MNEAIKKLQNIFSPLESELISEGPSPSIDIIKNFDIPFISDPNALYVGMASEMPKNISGITCALIQDVMVTEERAKGNNIFLFAPDTRLSEVTDKINQYFEGRIQYARITNIIMTSYLNNEALESLIKLSANEFGRAMILCDSQLKTLACSTGTAEEVKNWREFLEARFRKDISQQDKPITVEKNQWSATKHGSFYYIYCREYSEPDLLISITCGGTPVAQLLIKSGGSCFNYWERELISTTVEIIAAKLLDLQNTVSLPKSYPYEQFLIYILEKIIILLA